MQFSTLITLTFITLQSKQYSNHKTPTFQFSRLIRYKNIPQCLQKSNTFYLKKIIQTRTFYSKNILIRSNYIRLNSSFLKSFLCVIKIIHDHYQKFTKDSHLCFLFLLLYVFTCKYTYLILKYIYLSMYIYTYLYTAFFT